MADKSFGVKQINLIGASGTPTIESPNNLNLNATTVAISTDVTIGGQVQSDLKIGSSYAVGIGSTLPTAKLDVTGHTELDTLNVSGLSTFTELIDSNGGLDVTGHTELDNLNVSGISTIGSLNVSNLFTVGKDSFPLVGVITASDGGATDYFGESLATNSDGSSFAIGARFYDLPGYINCGAVYIVDRSGDTFTEVGILTAGDDIQQSAYFGSNVAMSRDGSTIVASAFNYDSGIGTEGRAYVFSRSGSTFTRIGILTASDEVGDQEFGNGEISVSQDGTYIAIGNYDDLNNGLNQVYIYEKNDGTYSEVGILTAGETRLGSEFGYSLQFTPDASTLIVGDRAFYGYVNIFERTGSNFNQVGVITAPASVTQFDFFAESVAITPDKSTIVVGVPNEDIGGSDIGNVFVYDRVGTTNNYVGIATLASSNPEAFSRFGNSVSINDDGSLIVVGARFEDNNGISNSGAAYVFRRKENTFTEVGILTSTNQNINNYFSYNSVAIAPDGSSIIVGEFNGDVGGTDYGNVFVYDVDNLSNIFTTADGKLSIGNPTPTAKLDVVGDVKVSGLITTTDLTSQQLNVSGVSTFSGLIDSNGGLDVTGHTELDNLNVSGVSTFTDNISLGGGNLSVGNAVANLAGIITASPSAGIQSYFGVNVACNNDGSSVIVIGINTFSQGTISLYDKNGSDYDFIGIVTDTNTAFTVSELPADCVMSDDGTIFAFSSGNTTVGAGNTIIVWQRSGSTISQLGLIEYDTLTGFGATEGISTGVEFGSSLDMSADGTKFVIGAERDRLSNTGIGTTTFTGRVHVVDRSGSTFTGIATLTPDALYEDEDENDRFGFNAVISDDGSTIIVSQFLAITDPITFVSQGAIYKFSRVGNTVTQVGLTTDFGNYPYRGGGLEISGDGSRIFVTSRNNTINIGSLSILDSDLNLLEEINIQNYSPGSLTQSFEDRKIIQSSYDGKTIIIGNYFYGFVEIYQYSDVLGRYQLLKTLNRGFQDGPNGVAISQDGKVGFIGESIQTDGELEYYDIFEDSKLLVAGSVGIGTTNPTAKLDVVGDVKVGINTSQGVILTSENGTKYRLIVDNSGNLSTVSVT